MNDIGATSELNLASEALHGPTGDFVRRAAEYTGAHPSGLLVTSLGLSGALLNRGRFHQHGYTRYAPNLHTVTVRHSLLQHPGAYLTPNYAVLNTIEDSLSAQAITFMAPGSITQKLKSDTPVVAAGEIDWVWHGLRRRGRLLESFRSSFERNPRFTLMGQATETDIREAMITPGMLDFASNIAWCVVPDLPEKEASDVSFEDVRKLGQQLMRAMDHAATHGDTPFSGDAKELWKSQFPLLTSPIPDDSFFDPRAIRQVPRLALVYALVDTSSEIKVDHLKAALAVWDYCKKSANRLFGDQVEDADAQFILEALEDGPLSQTELHRELQNHKSASWLNARLEMLESADRIESELIGTPGRPRRLWRLR